MTSETTPTVAVVSGSAEHEGGFFATRLDSAVAWSRKNSVWPLPLGLACCAIEFMATAASRYDMARFGMEVARFSPRQADLLFVAGWLTYKMAHVMTRLYDQMAEPRWVVAMGACASTGGMHRSYSVVQGIDEFVPVDVYVAGCPPRPEAVLNALIHLQQKIAGVRAPAHVRDGVADLPIARGGVGDVLGRGEMTPPVLVSAAERWVEGSKPRVVGESADGPDERRGVAPPAGCERDDALLRPFSVRWRVPLHEGGEPRADPVAEVALSSWVESAEALKGAGYDLLLDLTAVDYPDRRPRFSIAAVFMESATARRRILETRVAEGEAVPTLSKTFEAADWAERETYDLFGVSFAGHRNLTRILMPVDYEGWPLRRDFPCEGHLRFRD